jgi:hypothetical protein
LLFLSEDWKVNNPAELAKVLQTLDKIQQDFNRSQSSGKKASLADLIVLGGCAAVEQAAKNAGHNITVPFVPGRASQEQTDVESFAALEPTFDEFRNYVHAEEELSPETLLVERAFMLNLTAPEMTVLVGGMRALNANSGQSKHGVFTKRPGTLTNDFFVNLLDRSTEWRRPARIRTFTRVAIARRASASRPRVRLQFPAPRPRRALRPRGLEREVCERLRRGVEQRHEQRSLRGGLTNFAAAGARRVGVPLYAGENRHGERRSSCEERCCRVSCCV